MQSTLHLIAAILKIKPMPCNHVVPLVPGRRQHRQPNLFSDCLRFYQIFPSQCFELLAGQFLSPHMFDGTLLSVDRLVEGPARAGLTSFDKNCLCIGRGVKHSFRSQQAFAFGFGAKKTEERDFRFWPRKELNHSHPSCSSTRAIFRAVFDSRFSFFAPKLHGNAS